WRRRVGTPDRLVLLPGRLVDRASLDNRVAVALIVRHSHLDLAGALAALGVGAGEVDVIHAAVAGHSLVARTLGAHLRPRRADTVAIDRRIAVANRVGRFILPDAVDQDRD